MTAGLERREPAVSTADRSNPLPAGTWTIDPADTIVFLAWRTLLRWPTTGRLHGLGVIRLDELPPVGVIRFQQPSGLPVLAMAMDPAGVELGAAHLDAMGGGRDRLKLQGQGVVDRRAFGMGKRAWGFRPKLQLELAVHATRVDPRTSASWLPGTPTSRRAS